MDDNNLTDIEAAQVAREMIRTYQRTIGDPVSPPWTEAEDWDRESMVAGVVAVREGTITPAALHERWHQWRVAHGWVRGPVKDTVARVHPNLVPFGDLPPSQRRKDALFAAVVRALE